MRKFLDNICEEFLLFTGSVSGKYYPMMREVIWSFITDDDIELQLGEFLEHGLLHGFLRDSFRLVARAFSVYDRINNSDDDFLLLSILQDISCESGSCDSFAVEFSHSLPMEYCSRTPIGE